MRLGFVDVPGHERFVRNMLAGAGGIDLVLFVIAATSRSSRRRGSISKSAGMLGIKRGIVAVTKMDLVEPDVLGLVKLEIEEFVRGSFLEGAPILGVSAKTGAGSGIKVGIGRGRCDSFWQRLFAAREIAD